jgi:hypothetical protein
MKKSRVTGGLQSTVADAVNWLSSRTAGGGHLGRVLVTLRPKLQRTKYISDANSCGLTYSGAGGDIKGRNFRSCPMTFTEMG